MEKLKVMTAQELEQKQLPPVNWVLENFIPEGLTILAGAPKSGKSILAFNIALAVSSESEMLGKKSEEIKKVLYLPYEDSERRMQDRLKKNKNGLQCVNHPQTIFLDEFYPPRLEDFMFNRIKNLIIDESIKLIIVDTLGTSIPSRTKRNISSYLDEYELLNKYQRFAIDNKISLLVLHHTRKSKANSVFDEISGTRGITGAADANLVLEKNKMAGMLYVQGRDIEETNYDLELDKKNLLWKFKGISTRDRLTPEQRSIINAFEKNSTIELSPSEIAVKIDKADSNIRPNFGKLLKLGLLEQASYGKYKLIPPMA